MAFAEALSPELLARCHTNFVECLWQYVRSISGAVRRDVPEGTLVRCDLPSAEVNVLFLAESPARPEDRLNEARAFYGPKLPWRVLTTGRSVEPLERVALGFGMRPIPNDRGMLLDPIPVAPNAPSALVVRPVQDAITLHGFGDAWCNAFRIPRWVFPAVLPQGMPDDVARGVRNRLLVGYVGGRPVACSAVSVAGGIAGVTSVGTVRAVRGKGYGTAMSWRAIEAGRALGGEAVYLSATAMGYPVYERMGFRPVADYPGWRVSFGLVRGLGALRTLRRLARERRTH